MAHKKPIRAPFPWFGGKGAPKIRSAILEALPPHTRYLEPFGGGASILISKQPVQVEVYNDVNRGMVSFFRVVASRDYFGPFMARVREMPYSRELYEECLRTWPAIHDPVEQAVRWYFVARQSFSGIFGKSWGATVNSSNGGMAETTSGWRSSFENLPLVHDRMQRVQIECCDWRDVLRRYAGPGWLAYCDPPYVSGSRKAGGYEHELKDTDHEALIRTLLHYDGAVVLSGYDTPLYGPLAAAGWDKLEVEVTCSAAGRTRASGLQGAGKVKERQRRTECLWRNPEAMRRIRAVDSARK